VNDNRGRGFRFADFGKGAPYGLGEGMISVDVIENEGLASRAGLGKLRTLDPIREINVSLGSIRTTDVLRLAPYDLPLGVNGDIISNLAARSAWMSLAFLLRNAAARLLDAGPDELVTEISPRRIEGGAVVGEVFLADRLENGAGYATWLSRSMEEFVSAAMDESDRHVAHSVGGCDGSCYDCLRDYSNAAYHPLLDWCLGREALRLITGRDLDLSQEPWSTAIDSYARAFGWSTVAEVPGARVLTSQRGNHDMVVAHPLLATDPAADQISLALASSDRERAYVTSGYELARRPGLVEGRVRSGRGTQVVGLA
jgi:hypothetical protein